MRRSTHQEAADRNALLREVTSKTRGDVAFDAMARATERVRRLESEARQTFDEYDHARELCSGEGVAVDLELDPGIAAAFSSYKQQRARDAGNRDAREVMRARDAGSHGLLDVMLEETS